MDLFWSEHRDVVVKNLTILAPLESPNTDGVDPGEFPYKFFQRPKLSFFARLNSVVFGYFPQNLW